MREETDLHQEASAAVAANAPDAPWRHYPHLDAAIEAQGATVITNIERMRSEIARASQSGTAREKERAHAVLTAYSRALRLYSRLMNLRDRALRPGVSNMRGGATIKQ